MNSEAEKIHKAIRQFDLISITVLDYSRGALSLRDLTGRIEGLRSVLGSEGFETEVMQTHWSTLEQIYAWTQTADDPILTTDDSQMIHNAAQAILEAAQAASTALRVEIGDEDETVL